jgi:hypothetical protein
MRWYSPSERALHRFQKWDKWARSMIKALIVYNFDGPCRLTSDDWLKQYEGDVANEK